MYRDTRPGVPEHGRRGSTRPTRTRSKPPPSTTPCGPTPPSGPLRRVGRGDTDVLGTSRNWDSTGTNGVSRDTGYGWIRGSCRSGPRGVGPQTYQFSPRERLEHFVPSLHAHRRRLIFVLADLIPLNLNYSFTVGKSDTYARPTDRTIV